jgi:hypothetical protein
MSQSDKPGRPAAIDPEHALEAARQRLGTTLHQLARDLARERRRTADLERELAGLRAAAEPPGAHS